MRIKIFYDDLNYRLKGSRKILKFFNKVISGENKLTGDLYFIFTKDENIKRLNKKFLNHDYFTDVIAFGDDLNKMISGEIYISIDTVKFNAINYKVSFKNELIRVMLHGVLHLCGYEDKDKEEKKLMKLKEDYWLDAFKKEFNEF